MKKVSTVFLASSWLLVIASSLFAGTASNPLAENRRFVRGAGTDATFTSFIIPLDQQKGVEIDAVGDSSGQFGGQIPWFTRVTTALDQHYNITTDAWDIDFENPVVAFGRSAGGTPLYTGRTYRFGCYAGFLINSSSLNTVTIRIAAYDRSSLDSGQDDVGPVAVDFINVPTKTDQAAWQAFADAGFTRTKTVLGLQTVMEFVEGPVTERMWGAGLFSPYILTHKADALAEAYYYQIDVLGAVPTGLGAAFMAASGGWSKLYTMDFEDIPAWKSIAITQPQFQSEPLPPAYAGKSIQELLNTSTVAPAQLTTTPATALQVNHSPELRSHPALDLFVADMGDDPIGLINYVINEIGLTEAISYREDGMVDDVSINLGGMNRSALATFMEQQGNPTEQCALLIYLLRQAGTPAMYVFPEDNKLKMLDVRMSSLLRMQINGAVDAFGNSNVPTLIPVNYPGVAAYVDGEWRFIWPWIKDTEVIEGDNLRDYLPTAYNTGLKWVQRYLLKDFTIIPAENETFQQNDDAENVVVIEAESYSSKSAPAADEWEYVKPGGQSGLGAMQALPDDGTSNNAGYDGTSPELRYRVNFTQAGTHYVWIRGFGISGGDSVHVGIDGVETASADRIGTFTSGSWTWENDTLDAVRATINVSAPGVHTVNVWMRDDGFIFDKILLTTDAAYTPTGTGPTESVFNLVDDTPANLFPAWVEHQLETNYPEISIDDIGVQFRDRPQYYTRWEDFPQPFELTGTLSEVENLSSMSNLFDMINVEVYSDRNNNNQHDAGEPIIQTGDMRMADLHNRKFLVRHEKTGADQHDLILSLAPYHSGISGTGSFGGSDPDLLKRQVASVALTSADENLFVRIVNERHRAIPRAFNPSTSFLGINAVLTFDDQRGFKKGDMVGICLNAGRVTDRMLDVHVQEFVDHQRGLKDGSITVADPEVFQ